MKTSAYGRGKGKQMKNNSDLQFIERSSKGTQIRSDIDVSLTVINKGKTVALSLSNDAATVIGATGYIVAARLGGRLYLDVADEVHGFKLQQKRDIGRKYVQMPAKKLKINGDWIGYYPLRWNAERRLNFIEQDSKQG